ncbi:MAG: hypothetical protein FJ104_12670, partial [Deltaproteobacteria bacterium]|nr:hypothetical protein [Deltaproteobacteria bacterium]
EVLLAVYGCAGGAGVTDPSERSVCGERYTPLAPTLGAAVLALPAPPGDDTGVSVQFLAAAPALRRADVSFEPGGGGDPRVLGTSLPTGALAPTPPAELSLAELGPGARFVIRPTGDPTPALAVDAAKVWGAAGAPPLRAGGRYVIAQLGPYPGFAARSFWNDPVLVAFSPDL